MRLEKLWWRALDKRLTILFLTIPLFLAPSSAANHGGISGAYLRNPVGAKAAGMGGAFSASPDYLATWWNPAALADVQNKTLVLGGAYRSFGRTDGLLGYEFRIPPRISMGISALYRGDPFLDDLRDKEGDKLESGAYTTFNFKVGVSYLIRRNLTAGASIGIYYQKLPTGYDEREKSLLYSSATAIGGLDLAVKYALRPYLTFSAVLKNINTSFNWQIQNGQELDENLEESFPMTLTLGSQFTTKLLGYPLTWNSDAVIYLFESGLEPISHPTLVWNNGVQWQRWEQFHLRLGLRDVTVSSDLYRHSDLYRDTFSPALTAGFFMDLSSHLRNTSLNYALTTDKVWAGVEQQLDFVVSF